MKSSPDISAEVARDYAFRFDRELEPIVFGDEFDLSGWLLHRGGKPIHGIRALVRRRFFGETITRARRKRNRPELADAFPDLPEAEASGFLLELRLRLGRSNLLFQVLDHERRWQTFATGSVTAFPLTLLASSGLNETRHSLIAWLKRSFTVRRRVKKAAPFLRRQASLPVLPRQIDLFATSKSNLFILEIGELVAAGFRELGCEAQLHLDALPLADPPSDTLQLVVTPHEYYNLFLSNRVSRTEAEQLTHNLHLLCTEQPDTPWFEGNLRWGYHSLGVADISSLGVAAYRARGLPAHQLQLGYHPLLSAKTSIPHGERTTDITFLGSLTRRREQFFAKHADFFARHHSHLRLVPLGFAKTKEVRSYLETERRNELLAQSRIFLNLHYSEQRYLEWHRILLGLANGCCIISETCEGYGPLVPGRHFVMVDAEDLVGACQYYLAHPSECEKIARQGGEFVRHDLRQAQTCADYLSEVSAGSDKLSAFPLTPAHAPDPLPDELHHVITRRRRDSFAGALRNDLRNLFRKQEVIPETLPEISEPSLPAQRAAVVQRREGYRHRWEEQEQRRAGGESVWAIHDNAAFTHAAAPELSIVVTLYNYAHHIDECVRSVTAACARLPHSAELVIVNDASTDASLARALAALRLSKLPMRIIDKKFNTGLADARNVGTQIARAPYIFMMDADNLVFPEALKQLFDAITKDNYAAAYSQLCRFRGGPENRVGLLSYFDWDPQILVRYPYIDAMAMFRRDALLASGGYDNDLSQIGWFGWEDYDLWLRFAQRDYRVAFLPNTLCLYRHHDASMIKTTNLFEPELVAHFIERYGDLLGRFQEHETIFGVKRERLGELRSSLVSLPDEG